MIDPTLVTSTPWIYRYAAAAPPPAAAADAKNQYHKTPNHPSNVITTNTWFFNKSDNELSSAQSF